jgi:hypothetical protein
MTALIAIMTISTGSACDACGCSIMGQPNGLLSKYRKSFISLGYSHSIFKGTPGAGENFQDDFHTLDLSFDYYFSDRWRAGLFLPYKINTRTYNLTSNSIQGLSDTRADVNYMFYKLDPSASDWEVYLEAGAGLVLPTGKYDPDIHDNNMPENFNPGNGSFGYSLQQTSGISYRSIGTVIRNAWSDFADTPAGYQYGSQWVTSMIFLANIPLDSMVSVVPLGGLQMDKIWSDHYATGAEVHGTGGLGLYLSAGLQVKVSHWLCTFQYGLPLHEEYSNGEVQAVNRYTLQMTHLF